jgi:DNA-binding NtrC family response regulator
MFKFKPDEENSGRGVDNSIELLQGLSRMITIEIESLKLMREHGEERALGFNEEVKRLEISLIHRALLRSGGNQREAAKLLQLRPSTLNAKIKKLRIKYQPQRVPRIRPDDAADQTWLSVEKG